VDPEGKRVIVFKWPKVNTTCTAQLKRVLRINATHVAKFSYGRNRQLAAWTWDMVKPKGPWDFKLSAPKQVRLKPLWRFGGKQISAEDFGNIHFGYIGRAEALKLNYLKLGSWYVDGFSRPVAKQELRDQKMIAWGYRLFDRWGFNWQRRDDIFVRKGTKPG
jgi:hypothetical protein